MIRTGLNVLLALNGPPLPSGRRGLNLHGPSSLGLIGPVQKMRDRTDLIATRPGLYQQGLMATDPMANVLIVRTDLAVPMVNGRAGSVLTGRGVPISCGRIGKGLTAPIRLTDRTALTVPTGRTGRDDPTRTGIRTAHATIANSTTAGIATSGAVTGIVVSALTGGAMIALFVDGAARG